MFSRRTPLLAAVVVSTLAAATPARVSAQVAACPEGRVARVLVDNQSIFDEDEVGDGRFAWAFRLANRLHIRTRADWIRSEILIAEGDCYDPFRVSDSERHLRRYGFISRSEAFGVRRPDGDWDVHVRTEDEWSTRIEGTGEFDGGLSVRSLSASEENLLGRGILLSAFYEEREARKLVGGRFRTPRLLDSRTDFMIEGGETRRGPFWGQELVYPFVGEVGSWAFRQRFSTREDYFQYAASGIDGVEYVLLPVEEEFFELAVARRWGTPGDLLVAGIGVSRDRLEFDDLETGVELVASGSDFDQSSQAGPDVVDHLRPQTRFLSGTRVNLLFAHRAIRFVQRTGLDALRGVQDLEVGSDVSLSLGRTVGATTGSGLPDDLYARLRIYSAGAPAPFTFVFDGMIEGRQVLSSSGTGISGWRDLFAELRLWAYWQPGGLERHTVLGRVSGTGGWAVDQPFQLTLGGRTGVRGFARQDFPGAARLLVSAEDRIYLGWPAPDLFDLGLTVFADAGRIWAVDAPFGVDSGWKGTVGAGLRIGFPSESRGVIRVDLAFPVDGAGVGGPVLRISSVDLLGLRQGGRHPQLARSRRVLSGPDSFNPVF